MLSRVRRHAAVVLMITGLTIGVPLGVVLASHQFSDVPTSNPFHADIDALVDSGVTSGCGGGKYCPSANVTREQMAAFLNRLGALAPGKTPVVNATKLDGIDSTGFMTPGSVVTSIGGGSWQEHSGAVPSAGFRNPVETAYSGDGWAVLAMVAPSEIGGDAYHLATLQICMFVSGGGYLDHLYLFRTASNAAIPLVFDDGTDRTTSGCYSVAPNVTAGEGLGLQVNLAGGGQVILGSVKTTWSSP